MQSRIVQRRLILTKLFTAIQLLFPCAIYAKPVEHPVRVAVELCPPFVMKAANQYTGLSIFLWDNIAEELEIKYRIDEYNLAEMLEAVAQKKADIAVHCLSTTPEREEIIDFSQPFYQSHLSIAVKQHGFMHGFKMIFLNVRLYIVLGTIIGISSLIGGILFLMEHKVNDKLYAMQNWSGKLVEAFITGLLFLTSGPIRYYEFRTLSGRVLSAFLAVGSTLTIASVTALLASAFTLDQLRSEISGPQDLYRVKVGVMEETTSSEYLMEQGINGQVFNDPQEMLNALDEGKLDAVVWDSAILKYELKKSQAEGVYDSIIVLPREFEKQFYAFGLPDDSPHLEYFNRILLSVLDSPAWEKEVSRYMGK